MKSLLIMVVAVLACEAGTMVTGDCQTGSRFPPPTYNLGGPYPTTPSDSSYGICEVGPLSESPVGSSSYATFSDTDSFAQVFTHSYAAGYFSTGYEPASSFGYALVHKQGFTTGPKRVGLLTLRTDKNIHIVTPNWILKAEFGSYNALSSTALLAPFTLGEPFLLFMEAGASANYGGGCCHAIVGAYLQVNLFWELAEQDGTPVDIAWSDVSAEGPSDAAVPEPATYLTLAAGLVAIFAFKRRIS